MGHIKALRFFKTITDGCDFSLFSQYDMESYDYIIKALSQQSIPDIEEPVPTKFIDMDSYAGIELSKLEHTVRKLENKKRNALEKIRMIMDDPESLNKYYNIMCKDKLHEKKLFWDIEGINIDFTEPVTYSEAVIIYKYITDSKNNKTGETK